MKRTVFFAAVVCLSIPHAGNAALGGVLEDRQVRRDQARIETGFGYEEGIAEMKKVFKNPDTVSAIAAAVQTVVAVIMMATLWQNSKTLKLFNSQIESTVDPYLSLSLEYDACTDFRLRNESSIGVKDVAVVCALRYDPTAAVKQDGAPDEYNPQVRYGKLVVDEELKPSASVAFEFNVAEKAGLQDVKEDAFDEKRFRYEYALFIRYRRAIDGKPYLKQVHYEKTEVPEYHRIPHRILYHSTFVGGWQDGPVGPNHGKKIRELVSTYVNEDELKTF